MNLDLYLFNSINHFAGKWKILDKIAIFCAEYLIYLMIVFLFVLCFLQKNLMLFFYCLASGLLALLITRIIYLFFKEDRPVKLKNAKILIPIPGNPSFPSSHASFVFGLSFLLFYHSLELAVVFIACSCIVGLARVFCGIHWLSDIFGGAAAGLASAIIINCLLYFL